MWIEIHQALNKSTGRVITEIANLLPGIVALIVAMLVAGILAWIVAFLLRRSLRKIHFDERMTSWGFHSVNEWSPANTPTRAVYAQRHLGDFADWLSDWHIRV